MIHKKELKFSRNGIDFDATVTYEDEPIMSAATEEFSVYYRIQLHKPVELDCGGSFLSRPRGFMMYLLRREEYRTRRYFYKEDEAVKEENSQINVYPLAIEKVLYSYFNREKIVYHKKKIERFNNAVDDRYADMLELLKKQKLALRKLMRSGDIDSKEYQKRYTPIRREKEEIELKTFRLKHNYQRRYFECCELKKAYRVYVPDKIERCDDNFELCSLVSKIDAIKGAE